jgi:hypothetical protein
MIELLLRLIGGRIKGAEIHSHCHHMENRKLEEKQVEPMILWS